jgi:Rha family phage regulatory protein
VAEFFGKDHAYVCRSISNLIGAAKGGLGAYTFVDTPWLNTQNGQTYRGYEMDRDGFTLLAMGFTGAEALKFKLAYIAEFNRMEEALKGQQQAPAIDLDNPHSLRAALLHDF